MDFLGIHSTKLDFVYCIYFFFMVSMKLFCRKIKIIVGFSPLLTVISAFYVFVGIVASKSNELELKKCSQGGHESRATLRGGANAGNFSILRRTRSMKTCKELCCDSDSCDLALLVNGACFSVQCRSADACMPQKVKRSGVAVPRIFVRNVGKVLKLITCSSSLGIFMRHWRLNA